MTLIPDGVRPVLDLHPGVEEEREVLPGGGQAEGR